MTPHKHCELIKKWAEGERIQFFLGKWQDCENPTWAVDTKYRLKPDPVSYRIYLYIDEKNIINSGLIRTPSEEKIIERHSAFVSWVTSWIQVEI